MAYNGWSNYETWNVALWLDNEQGSYDDMRQAARDAGKGNEYKLSQTIKDYVLEFQPDLGASMFADLLNAALSEVDWYEIAEHYLADLDDDDDSDEATDDA